MGGGKETDKGRADLWNDKTRAKCLCPVPKYSSRGSLFGRHFHVGLKLVYINVDAAPGSLHEALLVSTSSQQPRVHIAASRRVVMLVFAVIRYRAAVTTFHFILLWVWSQIKNQPIFVPRKKFMCTFPFHRHLDRLSGHQAPTSSSNTTLSFHASDDSRPPAPASIGANRFTLRSIPF